MGLITELLSGSLSLLWYLAAFAVMIGILVVVHEAGHFYAARLMRVRVLRFAVGFGPVLFSKTDRRGTEYSLCALPLGGYVAMQDSPEDGAMPAPISEQTREQISEQTREPAREPAGEQISAQTREQISEQTREQAYREASLAARLFICIAGPVANLLLAVVLYTALFVWGVPAVRPVLGPIAAQSPAQIAGLRAGDEVRSVAGSEVGTLTDLRLELLLNIPNSSVPVEVRRAQTDFTEQLSLDLSGLDTGQDDFRPLRELGISSAVESSLLIGVVQAGSPAQSAGIEVGDLLVAANGEPVGEWRQWVELIRASPDEILQLTVLRAGSRLQLELVPELVLPDENAQAGYGRAGIGQAVPPELLLMQRYGLFSAAGQAVVQVMDISVLTAKSIYRIATGSLSVKMLSGPVGIARISGDAAEAGLRAFIYMMALLSISLGCINLVPIPILDGGRIAIHLVEAGLRRPLGEKVEMGLNALGLLAVGSLLILTLIQDIGRL